ncbi:MFS transporter [Actinacidiphila rubida]|uniref:Predicted arabinose efflux permease, MFS family n=1 Tax=Actinacidiphila rubida TaxID=310780 RepID=A0A1H8NIT7_9ACTN|nr:MFS transporter [Actinacidiphila rubida]SEO29358.1 Predicted arabinose efflux permease, MFS family [Actinacidiphila rubida]
MALPSVRTAERPSPNQPEAPRSGGRFAPRQPSARRSHRLPQVSHGLGFWFAAAGFAALMAFGTAPTPLWPLYEARDGFGSTTITVAFGVLVVGAAFGFVGLGHLSDRFGRRRVVVPALAVAVVAAVVLTLWTSLAGLLTGRVLNGVAIGLMASTATTYLHDLYQQEHPDRPTSTVPGTVATVANLGGLALGPLAAGTIAQWLPHPLETTQISFAAAMTVCLVLALTTPETVDRRAGGAKRPPRFALRPRATGAFAAACLLGFSSFALLGLVSSLGAVILHTELGITSHAVAGLAPFLMFAASAVAQMVLGRMRPAPMAATGAVAFVAGLALVTLSLYQPVLWLFLVAVTVAGAGAGVLFKGGVLRVAASAQPDSRAGVLALYFAASYLGLGGPAILFSLAIHHAGVPTTMAGFATVLSAVAIAAALAATRLTPRKNRAV